eukprot:TRINITY_DN2298_c0_g1_i3.p1 TRINITY_DN2298_c0_g1~~TRINITY_DN2298_c0_g1_i3.p1  ORF type:complete len:343 (-),score=57.07 TRINITY_DN2298_c0_g1_i3:73-1101(-)
MSEPVMQEPVDVELSTPSAEATAAVLDALSTGASPGALFTPSLPADNTTEAPQLSMGAYYAAHNQPPPVFSDHQVSQGEEEDAELSLVIERIKSLPRDLWPYICTTATFPKPSGWLQAHSWTYAGTSTMRALVTIPAWQMSFINNAASSRICEIKRIGKMVDEVRVPDFAEVVPAGVSKDLLLKLCTHYFQLTTSGQTPLEKLQTAFAHPSVARLNQGRNKRRAVDEIEDFNADLHSRMSQPVPGVNYQLPPIDFVSQEAIQQLQSLQGEIPVVPLDNELQMLQLPPLVQVEGSYAEPPVPTIFPQDPNGAAIVPPSTPLSQGAVEPVVGMEPISAEAVQMQ